MNFSLQPNLSNDSIRLEPLKPQDFERLYAVASDPDVWAMHPNKNRFQREVFLNFFAGAVESGGAFLVCDLQTGEVLGSTRFYDYNMDGRSILIGYTFYGTKSWGKNINFQAKTLMLNYIFQFVDKVIFHVGKDNIRSVKAMRKLGATEVGIEEVAYFGEAVKPNIVFEIKKEDWLN